MPEPRPGFFARMGGAFGAFWRTLTDAEFAAQLLRLRRGEWPPPPPAPLLKAAGPESALQLLGLLQGSGRLVDFLQEDVTAYTDTQVGAAARIVHEGCRKVLEEYFALEPVRQEAEGTPITVEAGFDAAALRLTGHVVGQPPFTGRLAHRGWRVARINLPKLAEGHPVEILAQAEVEL